MVSGKSQNSSNTGTSWTGRLDSGTHVSCSLFQKIFSDIRFIRFASKAGGLDDLQDGSKVPALKASYLHCESELFRSYGQLSIGTDKALVLC